LSPQKKAIIRGVMFAATLFGFSRVGSAFDFPVRELLLEGVVKNILISILCIYYVLVINIDAIDR
jgi:hypothetical protein